MWGAGESGGLQNGGVRSSAEPLSRKTMIYLVKPPWSSLQNANRPLIKSEIIKFIVMLKDATVLTSYNSSSC